MPNILLSDNVPVWRHEQLRQALGRRLDPELAEKVVITHGPEVRDPQVAIRTSPEIGEEEIERIKEICKDNGLVVSDNLHRPWMLGQTWIDFLGVDPELIEPLLETETMSPRLRELGGLHNVGFSTLPTANVVNLDGEPAPYAMVRAKGMFMNEVDMPEQVRAGLIARHFRAICDVELFLAPDDGRMTKFLPKRQ